MRAPMNRSVVLSILAVSTSLAAGCNPRQQAPIAARSDAGTTAARSPTTAPADVPPTEGPTGALEGVVRINGTLGRFPAIVVDSGTASRPGCRDAATRIYTNPFPVEAPGPMPEALVTVDARSATRPPRRRRMVTFHDCSISPRVLVMSLNDQVVLHAETDVHHIPKVDGLGATIAQMLFHVGKLPFNTDGGGLCNNHPANRGGMTKVIEAVRQLRGEAHPKVQVPGCTLALAHGTGGLLGTRHGSATVVLERE